MVKNPKIKEPIDHSLFKPDYTPEQIFTLGAFGGTYFRRINSTISKQTHENDYLEFKWAHKLPLNLLTSDIYDKNVNRYGVSCGTSLELWESSNWIRAPDYRGWVQWYCRYHEGRRTEDDDRQIRRWLNVKRRFGGWRRFNKQNKPSMVVKQVLLHWAISSEDA